MDEDQQKELGTLLAYLSLEAAATGVFRVTVGKGWECIHLNAVFNDLDNAGQVLEALKGELNGKFSEEQDVNALHGRELEDGRWQIRVVSSRHCVLTMLSVQDVSKEQNGDTRRTISSLNGNSEDSLDWTRHAIKNSTPWIDFICSVDWSTTGVGPMESWSPLLRQYALHIMSDPEPRLVIFGESMTFIYNEPCIEFFGAKHPQVMGQSVMQAWSELWESVKPMIEAAYDGSPTKLTNCPMFLERHGYAEETFWNFTMVPIIDPATGKGVGLIDEFTEVSAQVADDRRRVTVNNLSNNIKKADTLPHLWTSVLESMEVAEIDVAFTILYAIVDDVPEREEEGKSSTSGSQSTTYHPKKLVLVGTVGIPSEDTNLIDSASLPVLHTDSELIRLCSEAWETRTAKYIRTKDGTLPAWLSTPISTRSFGDPIRTALVSPLRSAGDDVLGVLVTGVNPRVPLNSSYKLFLNITAEICEKAAALISLPDEQRRAQAVSDEITTSLTQQLRLYTLQAEKSEAKFSRMAASSPIGMYMFDAADGKPLYANDAYLDLLGVTRETHAIIPRPDAAAWWGLIHEEDM